MGVPKQIEDAANEAEEYLKSLSDSEAEDTDETEDAEGEIETEEETTDDADVEDDEQDEEDLYRNKYLTLKGKYDAEVPTLHKELKELKENIFGKIDELAKTKNSVEETDDLGDDEIAAFKEEYGEDLVQYLDKYLEAKLKSASQETANEVIKPLEEKVQSVEDSQIAAAKEEFATYLDENVKGEWQKAADDPKFIKFLEKTDPSGLYTYGDLLTEYNNNWDHEKMAKVFNIFYEGNPKKEAPPQKDAIVAPSRKTEHSVPTGGDKIIWTEESMQQFYKDDRARKIPAEESAKLWEDLMLAASEGRIK
jgi:hypothetical protein